MSSYYVFYRYFATLRWFLFQKKEFDRFFIQELSEEFDIFIFDFTKITNPELSKIVKKNQITPILM